MGTRNITRVILNKEIVVDQYCQWDGYPTGHGENVMKFVKTYCGGHSLTDFKKSLSKSTLMLAKAGVAMYTGARPSPATAKLETFKYEHGGSFIDWTEYIEKGEVTKQEVTEYLAASRDTGSDILYWLIQQEPDGMTFYTTDYTYNMTTDLDWQIEGMYIIDLDSKKVTIDWHGKTKQYTFKEVDAMSEEKISAEMFALERRDDD